MSKVIDNLIAFKVLYMLVTPFEKTKAFKMGIIDKDGNALKKTKDLKTSEEKDSYTQLDKLVFSLKRILGKIPGGKSQLASIVAAYYLIKENINRTSVDKEQFDDIYEKLNNGLILVDEEVEIEKLLDMFEDAPTNSVGDGSAVGLDNPVIRKKKKDAENITNIFRRLSSKKLTKVPLENMH